MGIRHLKLPAIAVVLSVCAAAGIAPVYTQSPLQNRITQAIRANEVRVVHGTVHPEVATAQDQGELSGSTVIQDMTLVFRRSAAQEADLKNLLQQQQTPGSALYRQWLKPGEFAARYGVSSQDLTKVSAWLASQGFQVAPAPAGADRIHFSGTASQVEAAFHTRMHRYLLHRQTHWANATEISLPQAIAGMALGIGNLTTFRPQPHFARHEVNAIRPSAASLVQPHYTLQDQNGNEVNMIAPADAQTIYDVAGLYNSSITGTGQTLAVVGQTDITKYQNDIKNFRLLSGLNANNLPTQIVVPGTGNPQVSSGDLTEADIDVEWSGAIAKDANILYVTVGGQGGNVFNALAYAVQTPLVASGTKFVPVISISYGACEPPPSQGSGIQQIEQLLEQANSQGQTIVAASGDEGSADCDYSAGPSGAQNGLAVDYPGSSQYVTSVGGSSFSGDVSDQSKYWSTSNSSNNGSALSYIPETTWNNTPTLQDMQSVGQLSAGGGGASALFSKPSWQAGPGVPNDNNRDVPDVSLASDPGHDGYVLCTEAGSNNNSLSSTCVYPLSGNEVAYFPANNQGYLYGGTSIAAPQLAAMITLWNQKSGNTGGIGNANPIFYLSAANNPSAFHDITTGSNAVVCKQGSPDCVNGVMSCCSAGTGYDKATGLGSVDAGAVAAIWPDLPAVNASFSLLLSNAAISVNPGGSQTTNVVLTPSGAGANSMAGFSGTVNLACSNLPAGVSCSFAPGSSVTLSPGATQTVTLTVSATASAAATTTAHRSTPVQPIHRNWPMQTAFAGIFGFSLLGFGKKRRPFHTPWAMMLLLAVGLIAATALTACGGGSASSAGGGTNGNGTGGNPTPITQTITVTGTSGAIVASAQIQLTVT